MGRREKEKRDSLATLAKIAERATESPRPTPPRAPTPSPPRAPTPSPPRAASPPRRPSPLPSRAPSPSAARARQLEERRLKLEEEKRLKARRAGELQRGANLEWRGMDQGNVPTGIRRTAFDRVEPSVSQKIQDVLGDAKEKEGRAKNRAKGRRQGG